MHPTELCLFCDNPPDSKHKEDSLPVWVQSKMGKGKRPIVVVDGFSGKRSIVKQALKSNVKTGCVCWPCNNGWMSQLEGKARKIIGPLMEDIHLQLDAENKLTIARWAIKTAMTTGSLNRNERPVFYTREEHTNFKESWMFPRHTRIWLGRYGGSREGGIIGNEGWDGNPKNPEVTHFYTTTFILKRLIIQVLSIHVWDYHPGSLLSVPTNPGPWNDCLIDLGSSAILFWPPELSFSDGGNSSFERLISRFNVGARLYDPFNPTD